MVEQKINFENKEKSYHTLSKQLEARIEEEPDITANLAKAAALLIQFLARISRVCFYIWTETELVLGPFQGLTACIRIPANEGVCGTDYSKNKTMVVPNVNEFPGHIVGDAKSQSEIVIPVVINNEVYGVLDIDSPILDRFDETDRVGLEIF